MGKKIKNRNNKQKKFYSGKKKRYTQKFQVLVNLNTKQILRTNFANGKKHDFKLFQEKDLGLCIKTEILADSGYQGIKLLYPNSQTPKKNTKKQKLTKQCKKGNHNLSKKRIFVENVIRELKVFRILSSKYRNRRKRWALRLNLIAGLYNYELGL